MTNYMCADCRFLLNERCEKGNAHGTSGSDVTRTLRYGGKFSFSSRLREYILSMVIQSSFLVVVKLTEVREEWARRPGGLGGQNG